MAVEWRRMGQNNQSSPQPIDSMFSFIPSYNLCRSPNFKSPSFKSPHFKSANHYHVKRQRKHRHKLTQKSPQTIDFIFNFMPARNFYIFPQSYAPAIMLATMFGAFGALGVFGALGLNNAIGRNLDGLTF